MKLYIHSAKDNIDSTILKNVEFNRRQTQVGSKLKTYRGSPIQRSTKYGVGKEIGGDVYVHKNYADEVVPLHILDACEEALDYYYSDFNYNCIRWSPAKQSVSFQEVSGFDDEREPRVGKYITVFYEDDKQPKDFKFNLGSTNYIFHHKWIWVDNSYSGFDVSKSWNWSKKWLSTLRETSDGNGISRWNAQLDKYDLPHDQ